jgi:hypothetical protein
MGVFTPAQREAHVLTTTKLIQAVQRVQDVENGYEFTFPSESEFISRIAEFISNERLCCPFLDFSLHVFSNQKPIRLTLTGPTGTQEFLRAEFEEAIP